MNIHTNFEDLESAQHFLYTAQQVSLSITRLLLHKGDNRCVEYVTSIGLFQ